MKWASVASLDGGESTADLGTLRGTLSRGSLCEVPPV